MFNDLESQYLNGRKFSNGEKFKFSNSSNILYRNEYLLSIAKDKKVIHLGFVDHIPLIDEKIQKNSWLHKKLMDVTEVCYGIDINKEGIEYLQNKYNFEKLYALDVVKDSIPSEILQDEIDYLLIPDVIEHIGNPVEFLSLIREKLKNNVKKVIITTPNALRIKNFIEAFRETEYINTDHRFWFTPYTLSKIATDAGYKLNNISFHEHGKSGLIKKLLLANHCLFKDTLVLELSFK